MDCKSRSTLPGWCHAAAESAARSKSVWPGVAPGGREGAGGRIRVAAFKQGVSAGAAIIPETDSPGRPFT